MGYSQLLVSQRQAGTLFNTYTTAKSVINPQAIYPLQPRFMKPGDMLRIRVSGGVSNIVTAQPTFTFQAMLGTAQPSTIIAHASQAVLTTTTVHTLSPFEYDLWMRLDTDGSGTNAKFLSQGKLTGLPFIISGAVADPTLGVGTIMCPATAPAVGTGFDHTVLNYLDFFVGISVSSASNGIQIYQYTVHLYKEEN